MKDSIILKIEEAFKDIYFVEEGHKYYNIRTGEEYISVTTLKKKFTTPFEYQKWLSIKAKELGVSEKYLKKEWDEKKLIGTTRGTLVHNFLENYQKRKVLSFDAPVEGLNKLFLQGRKLIEKLKKKGYVPLIQELVVGYNGIAGQVDCIFYDTKNDQLVLGDFKTDSKTLDQLEAHYNKYMQEPFQDLPDSTISGYYIQLNIYREILKKVGIDIGKMEIYHLNKDYDKAVIIDVPFVDVAMVWNYT